MRREKRILEEKKGGRKKKKSFEKLKHPDGRTEDLNLCIYRVEATPTGGAVSRIALRLIRNNGVECRRRRDMYVYVCTCPYVENIEVPRIYSIDSCIRQSGEGGEEKNILDRCREHDIAHRVTNNVLLRLKTVTGYGHDILKLAVLSSFAPFFTSLLFLSFPPPFFSHRSSILLHDRLHFILSGTGGVVEEMYPNCSLFARFRHERPFQQAKNKLNRKLVRVVFLNLRLLKRAVFVQHRGKYIRNRRLAFACFGTRLKGKLDNYPCCANTQIFKIVPLLTSRYACHE